MSIRIHKGLGFTFPDLKHNDPRINYYWYQPEPKRTMEGFSQWSWIKQKQDEAKDGKPHMGGVPLDFVKDMKVYSLTMTDNSEVEEGDEDTETPFWIVKSPVSSHHHYDDDVDYAETMLDPQAGCRNSVRYMPTGFYPWSNSFMFAETGERANVRSCNGIMEIHDHELWEKYGLLSDEELREIFVPMVPEELRNMCEYFGMLTDMKHVIALRPVIYTYWN